jgi:hypothetical protein
MSISRRIATGLTAAAIATCGLVGAGAGIGVTAAVAAPAGSHHCPSHSGKYPPGKCRIYFSKHVYHKHHRVRLASGRVFKPGERLTVTLICPRTKHHKRYVRHLSPRRAGIHGAASSSFKLNRHTPTGSCQVVLHGKHSHVTLTGTIHVRK